VVSRTRPAQNRKKNEALVWTSDMDCAACHARHVGSISKSDISLSAHGENGVDQCMDCHEEEKLKVSHAKVIPGKPSFVKARKYPQEFCLRCHGTHGELAKRTADSKALTDTKGRVANPHDVPKNAKHYKIDECYTCHRMHKKDPDVMRYCSGCHHMGEFSCGTCHP
jgi:hypothetical protein